MARKTIGRGPTPSLIRDYALSQMYNYKIK